MDLADSVVAGTRSSHPCCNVSVGSTGDTCNVDIAGGVVVASLVATVVDGALGRALCCVDSVREGHTTESWS